MATQELLGEIIERGWAGLESWCRARQPETEGLEFKPCGDAVPSLNAFDKGNIGKTCMRQLPGRA